MDYNNSDKSRSEIVKREPLKPVGKGRKVKVRKSLGAFFAEDFSTLKDHFIEEMFFPWLKHSIYDILNDGLCYFLLREDPTTIKRPRGAKIGYTAYDKLYKNSYDYRDDRPRQKGVFDYDDAEFDTRTEAEMALAAMEDEIERYGFTTVGSLYELAEITTNESVVEKYGWSSLSRAKVRKSSTGWIIDLPRAMPIER